MLTDEFLVDFKRSTEDHWRHTEIDRTISGFQFQRGTRWNPGISDQQIDEYEGLLEVRLPEDFRKLLRVMNGTDLATINVYAFSGEPLRQSVGVYSYPKNLGEITQRMKHVEAYRDELVVTMAEQGFSLSPEDSLVPIYIHRYVVCTSDPASSVVLSIDDGNDAIVYGDSLREYLVREFLGEITTDDSAHPAVPSLR